MKIFQVETVGTVYMLVSGAPERRRAHAAAAASAALAISRAIPALTIGKKTFYNNNYVIIIFSLIACEFF